MGPHVCPSVILEGEDYGLKSRIPLDNLGEGSRKSIQHPAFGLFSGSNKSKETRQGQKEPWLSLFNTSNGNLGYSV